MKNLFRSLEEIRLTRPALQLLLAGFFISLPLAAADFGDAPDGTDTFYPVASGEPAIVGQFPTLLTSNGARHTNLTDCWLGGPDSAPSSEADANDGADPDGLANLVNNDANDDGLPVIPFYLNLNGAAPTATVTVKVTVPAGAPDVPRTLNMLVDWDQSGDWKNPASGAPEWAVQNFGVNVTPGTTELISIPITWGLDGAVGPQVFWCRLTLTQTPIFPASFFDGWDGTGSFTHGETEDFLFHPNRRHDASVSPWLSPTNPVPGGGLINPAPSISMLPSNQSGTHGEPATVLVNLDAGNAPDSLEWAIDPAQRGSNTFDTGLAQQSFGSSYSVSGTTASATLGGTLPTLGSISLTSVVDPSTPAYEEWPIRVRATWNGVRTQTVRSVVRIWHSGWTGAWAVTEHFGILEQYTLDIVPSGQQATALSLLSSAFDLYKTGDNFNATLELLLLDSEFVALQGNGHINAIEEVLLRDLTTSISEEVNNLGFFGGIPVPFLSSHADGDILTGSVLLEATTDSSGIIVTTFSYSLDGVNWVQVSEDLNGGNGWTATLDTTSLPDGILRLKVDMFDGLAFGEFEAVVWVDNSAPSPTLSVPVAGSTVAGIIPLQVDTDTSDDLTTLLELSDDGSNWYEIGTDADSTDGHTTLLDSGQLPAGSYTLRATVTDEQGNSTQDSWSFTVAPSFHAWRIGLGLPTAQAGDDTDLDGLSLGEEYYLGLSSSVPEAESDYLFWEPLGGSNFQFRFTPATLVDGLRASVEGSGNLSTWSDLLLDPDTSGEVIVPVDTSPQQFVRLNVWEDRP